MPAQPSWTRLFGALNDRITIMLFYRIVQIFLLGTLQVFFLSIDYTVAKQIKKPPILKKIRKCAGFVNFDQAVGIWIAGYWLK